MIEQNKDLAPLTTFGVTARARYFARYNSVDALRKIMRDDIFRNNQWLHIGAGSNLLFASDYQGLILKSDLFGIRFYRKDDNTVFAIAAAGEDWSDFVNQCVEQGAAGLENLAGIPGTVGASAIQNVGAYGVEAGDLIHAIEVMDTLTGQIERLTHDECQYAYRDSRFKHEWKGRYIVLRVSFRLRPDTIARNLKYGPLRSLSERLGHTPTIAQVRDEVLCIRAAKLPDPAELGSAGSFFKNPVVDEYYYQEVIRSLAPDLPTYPAGDKRIKLAAGWLIEHAGMKGCRCGGAEVYPGQSLVIVNRDHATADDILRLSHEVQLAVRRVFHVELQPEVNIIDTRIIVTVLGSGTSKGIPEIGCLCPVCTSDDAHDKRLRASVWVRTHGLSLLIDPSPDFRQQAIQNGIESIDAVLVTHSHYDHVGGIDDLRPYCINGDISIYLREDVANDLRRRLDYCFRSHLYPGVPSLQLKTIHAEDKQFFIDGLKVEPIHVMHGRLPITGYRIGDFAYITDASHIDDEEMERLTGLDTLIINALRHRPHFAHYSLQQALDIINRLKPRRAYLTHFSHEIGRHADLSFQLPPQIQPAYDGLTITIDR